MSNDHSTLEPDWIPEPPATPPERGFALPLSVWEMAALTAFRKLKIREQIAMHAAMRALASGEHS